MLDANEPKTFFLFLPLRITVLAAFAVQLIRKTPNDAITFLFLFPSFPPPSLPSPHILLVSRSSARTCGPSVPETDLPQPFSPPFFLFPPARRLKEKIRPGEK